MPPKSCTSKCLSPKVLLATSLTTAKASGKISSKVSPFLSLSLNSKVLDFNSSRFNLETASSKLFILETMGDISFIYRELASPNILFKNDIISLYYHKKTINWRQTKTPYNGVFV